MSSRELLPILVAVGDSDVHEAALIYAADQALRDGRGVQLVHVVHGGAGGGGPENALLTFRGAQVVGEQLVHRAAARVEQISDGRVRTQALTRTGATVPVLLELGERADRVVLQHRQQSRLTRIFTGSTTAGVAARCGVPVVSVPESWTGPLTTGAHVTVAVDGPDPDEALLRHAFETAGELDGTLTVLHAWFLPTAYDDAVTDRGAMHAWSVRRHDELEERIEPWRRSHPTVQTRVHVLHMRPVDALLQASGHSDLLVVGRNTSRHRLPHLGSLSRALIHESLCPVSVVPAALPAHEQAAPARGSKAEEVVGS